jgi:hypothetical protein
MKEFFKLLLKIITYSAGFAVFGGIFLLADSVKNKPLSKDEVKDIVKIEVAPVISTLNDHLESTQMQQADFRTLETSHINTLKMINRLDDVIKYYEQKAENEKKNNNGTSLYRIPSDTTRLNTLSSSN